MISAVAVLPSSQNPADFASFSDVEVGFKAEEGNHQKGTIGPR